MAEALAAAEVAAEAVIVENDGLVALRGAAEGGRGMLIVGGTGSVVFAGNGRHYVRAGGWGHRVGDVGSAYEIARSALAVAYQAWDGFPIRTELPRYLCEAVGAPDLPSLQDWLYDPDTRVDSIAALARVVDQAAAAGDPEARATW